MPTKISWTDETWNFLTGCSPISEGCTHCYARRMARRLRGRFGYDQDNPFQITEHPDKQTLPFKWKKPKRVFVDSMGDLFDEDVKEESLLRMWDVMTEAPEHTFLILTKRPDRMAEFMSGRETLKNLWLGVTTENQETADERLPIFAKIKATKRFVSAEPLLSSIDLGCTCWLSLNTGPNNECEKCGKSRWLNYAFDWLIVGSETGSGARPMDIEWARNLKNQCREANVPFFFKSAGPGIETPDDLKVQEWPSETV